ncbi:hypothetical protein [Streptomyces sp. NPDC002889]
MEVRTLGLLTAGALVIGIAYLNPPIGIAVVVGVAVVALLHEIVSK